VVPRPPIAALDARPGSVLVPVRACRRPLPLQAAQGSLPQTDLVVEAMDTPVLAIVLMVVAVPSTAGGELAPLVIRIAC
jgi:hypothetical protein